MIGCVYLHTFCHSDWNLMERSCDWSSVKMQISRLFSPAVAVIMILLIKQQLDNNTLILEPVKRRRRGQEGHFGCFPLLIPNFWKSRNIITYVKKECKCRKKCSQKEISTISFDWFTKRFTPPLCNRLKFHLDVGQFILIEVFLWSIFNLFLIWN